MWVENNDKARIKTYLRSDINSNITNVVQAQNRVYTVIAAINRTAGGSGCGADQKMQNEAQMAKEQLQNALNKLAECRNYVDQLETREWVEDDQC